MSYGLYISSEGAMSQEYRMQTIANNIANVETPGFKREVALQMARHTASVAIGEIPFGSGLMTDIRGGVHTIGTHTEFKQGSIAPTELNSDIAIEGDGWYRVRDVANGEEFLTRSGHFQVDRNGTFVTEWGRSRFQLLDTEGEAVMLPVPESQTWHITDDGVLHDVGVGRVQQIALVQPDDLKTMVKIGENVYRLDEIPEGTLGYQDIPDAERPRIRSGHLEMSAVNPSTEMIEMIIASRSVETNVKMMHTQDEATGALLSRVLRVG
jgi:flagellar basal body rod protein FlgG